MSFKRALWSSGFDYLIRCPYCGTNNKYTDKALDFRPWYPNGFIYCATCRKPLRHNEIFAVDAGGKPVFDSKLKADEFTRTGYYSAMGYDPYAAGKNNAQSGTYAAPAAGGDSSAPGGTDKDNATEAEDGSGSVRYCSRCGRSYKKGRDAFCAGCGAKLPE